MSALALALSAILAVDGGVADAPTVTRLKTGEYLFSAPAYKAVDDEMRRLQDSVSSLEAEKRASEARKANEPGWFPIVMISVLTGLVVGAAVGAAVGYPLGAASQK